MCGLMSMIFYLIPFVNLSVFMPIPGCFHYYSTIVELCVRDGDSSGSSLIIKGYFGYPWVFVFPYKVEYCSFKVCEELCWDFDEDCNESINCFWQNRHFCCVNPTKSMGDLSIFCYLLQFLSSKTC